MRLLFFLAALAASAQAEASTSAAAKASEPAPVVTTKTTKKVEEFSSANRIGCAANLNGYHFNLKELSLPIDE